MSKVPKAQPKLIDFQSEMQNTHEVYVLPATQPIEMSVLMMKVDIKPGMYGIMRYYIVQLLKEKKNGYLTLWTRWGRLGDRGQNQKTPFRLDEKNAVKEFKKIIKQKAGLVWEDLCAQAGAKKLPYMMDKYRVV